MNLGQVEMVLSMMPRGDSVVLSAFEDAVNVVPPLHEVRIRPRAGLDTRACVRLLADPPPVCARCGATRYSAGTRHTLRPRVAAWPGAWLPSWRRRRWT